MKNLIILCTVIISVLSCSKKSSNPEIPFVSFLKTGTWKVSNLGLNSIDKTAALDGYNFTFRSGDNVTATSGSGTINGVWGYSRRGMYFVLTLTFVSGAPAEMSGDWDVNGVSPTQINCHRNFSVPGSTDILDLVKN